MKKLLVACLVAVFFVCALEFSARLYLANARTKIPPCPDRIEDFGSHENYDAWQNHLEKLGVGLYYGNENYAARTALWNKPNYSLELPNANVNIHFNSLGFRSGELQSGKLRIFLVGASTVLGGPNDRWTISYYLQKEIPNAQIINAGALGFSSENEFMLLKSTILDLNPDLVIVLDGSLDLANPPDLRDASYARLQKNLDQLINTPDVTNLLGYDLKIAAKKSDLLMLLLRTAHRGTRGEFSPPSEISQGSIESYLTNIKLEKSLLETRGVHGMLCFQPIFGNGKSALSNYELGIVESLRRSGRSGWIQTVQESWPRVGQLVANISPSALVKTYDLSSAFQGTTETTYADDVHYAPAGDRILAEKLAFIIRHDFLSEGDPP